MRWNKSDFIFFLFIFSYHEYKGTERWIKEITNKKLSHKTVKKKITGLNARKGIILNNKCDFGQKALNVKVKRKD